MKYLLVFISNQLIWASDCSTLFLAFGRTSFYPSFYFIHLSIKFILTKQSMIFKFFYYHTYVSKVFIVIYFDILTKKMGCAISRYMSYTWYMNQTSLNYVGKIKQLENLTTYRVFSVWEQTFLRYVMWNLVVFSRLINIYKVTEWTFFIEWSSMNELSTDKLEKVESWIW